MFVAYLSAQNNQISNFGNIGIGTTSPNYPLEVFGEVRLHGNTRFDSTAVFGDSTIIETLKIEGNLKMSQFSMPGMNMRPAFFDENGVLMTIGEPCKSGVSGGEVPYWQYDMGIIYVDCPKDVKVGIGTSNPLQNLHVIGSQYITRSLGLGTSDPLYRLDLNAGLSQNRIAARFYSSTASATPQNNDLFLVSRLGNNGYNNLSAENDFGIFWNDNGVSDGVGGFWNNKSGLVIGPHNSEITNPGIKIAGYGYVGIGNKTPSKRLEVSNGALLISGENGNDGDTRFIIADGNNSNDFAKFSNSDGDQFLFNSEGKFYAHEIEVKLGSFPDYVFEDDYNLLSLAEVEQFIKINKHLPDVPNEKTVLEEGLNLGDMDALLLKKVEELTLYIIDQQKQITELQKNLSSLQTLKN